MGHQINHLNTKLDLATKSARELNYLLDQQAKKGNSLL